jgi:prepilin peptidase CpaA
MQGVICLVAAWLFALVAYGDLKARRIPNELCLAVAALGLGRMVVSAELLAAGWTIAAALGVFAVAFLLFARGYLGGGDAKLVTASILLVGYDGILEFIVAMAMLGGVLSLLVLAEDRVRNFLGRIVFLADGSSSASSDPSLALARPTVPYGVAIAFAGLWVLVRQTLIG